MPDIGDDKADFKAVQAFYDFWYGFKSWREFPHEDEEDPEVLPPEDGRAHAVLRHHIAFQHIVCRPSFATAALEWIHIPWEARDARWPWMRPCRSMWQRAATLRWECCDDMMR